MAPSIVTVPEDAKLLFKAPMDGDIMSELKIKNTGTARMAFKVKASDNTLLRIEPPVGILKADQVAEIQVTAKPKGKCPRSEDHFLTLYEFDVKEDQTSSKKVWEQEGAKKKKRNRTIFVVFDEQKKPEEDEEGEKKEGEKKE